MPDERGKRTCGAKTRAGTPCQHPAGWRTDHPGEGRCRMHGGCSPGAPKGNQNARKHGVWSVLLSDEDREFLAADPKERLATLQAMAELRAFRAHQAGKGKLTDGVLDTAFARNAAQAANLARTRLAIAEAAAEGVHMDGRADDEPKHDEAMTDRERVAALAQLLDSGAAAGDGAAAGAPDLDAAQSAPGGGAAQPG